MTNEGNEVYDNTIQTVVAIITKCRYHTTKKNDIMGFITVEDLTGSIDVIAFLKVFEKNNNNLTDEFKLLMAFIFLV